VSSAGLKGNFTTSLWFYNTAGLDTACTDPYSFCLTILKTSHLLKIGVPSFFGFVMGMTDIVSNHRFFTTDITNLCHFGISFEALPAIANGQESWL